MRSVRQARSVDGIAALRGQCAREVARMTAQTGQRWVPCSPEAAHDSFGKITTGSAADDAQRSS
jgi:hypothetical protein